MSFDLKNYEMVEERLKRFMEAYKDSAISITTEIVPTPACLKGVTFKATIEVTDIESSKVILFSTGWANEVPGEGAVNRDAPLENCETSAVGRALANLGYHGSKRPSAEEMKKVGSNSYHAHQPTPTANPSANTAPSTPKPSYATSVGTNAGFMVTFGKYKGKTFGQIGPVGLAGYIKWVKSNDDWQKKDQTVQFVKIAEEYLKSLSGN